MKAIGIDLGTTYSLVATVDEAGKPIILLNAEGALATPSVIWFPESGEPVVGRRAKRMQEDGATPIAAFFKTNMGDRNAENDVHGRRMSPTDYSTILLRELAKDAGARLREPVTDAVITIPAYFEDAERNATLEAARRAGINVLRLLHEPAAAALSVGMDKLKAVGRIFLVYDLGGGTFDASIVELADDGIVVRATDGNHELGGKNWDEAILNHVRSKFEEENGFDPVDDLASIGELRVACEKAKMDLGNALEVRVKFRTDSGARGDIAITRTSFESITEDLLGTTKLVVDSCLRSFAEKCRANGWHPDRLRRLQSNPGRADSRELWKLVDQVLLVGGSTRMPMVADYIRSRTGCDPIRCLNPDESVALGAAIFAAQEIQAKSGANALELVSATPNAGTPTLLVRPAKMKLELPVLCDITAHTMGMIAESADRSRYVNSKILPKNSPIPNTERKIHELLTDGEKPMEVFVTQGESDEWFQCKVVRKFEFSGIAAPSEGLARIEVSYTYDENGIVKVEAKQLSPDRMLACREMPAPSDDELARFHRSPKENDPPPRRQEGSVVLAIDTSGSMRGDPIGLAKTAALDDFVARLPEGFRIGVVSFDDVERVELECNSDRRRVRNAIKGLKARNAGTRGDPFAPAARMLIPGMGKKYVVVLSDGQWFESSQGTVLGSASRVKQMGAIVLAIGFGEADELFLRRLASPGATSIKTDIGKLGHAFSTIAKIVSGC